MSCVTSRIIENSTAQAVLKAPIEVWQEIIDHVLYDPIAFLTDPYYPGCNLHTAFNEWNDRRRLRRLEAQRGTLRLVSRPWKDLIDSRPWKYFEPCFCSNATQQSAWAQSARRLNLDNVCVASEHVAGSWVNQCEECLYYKSRIPAINDNFNLDARPFGATIVRMPVREKGGLYFEVQYSPLDIYFPNVRALFIWYRDGSRLQPVSLFSRLTFLSLCLDMGAPLDEDEVVVRFSALKTFNLELLDDERIDFLEQWDMPLLAHFQISMSSFGSNVTSFFTLLAQIGKKLVRLCLRIQREYVDLPSNFWEGMPMLKYFSTTVLKRDSNFPLPPFVHSLRIFALLKEESHMDDAREIAYHLAEVWKTLDTICDCHSWNDVPRSFYDVVNSPDSHPGFYHNHHGTDCWQCIEALYLACQKYGLRYEDREGRTLPSFEAAVV